MKDYIVTVEETYFDATKFDFNKFYIVTEKDVKYKCLLKTVEKDKATFVTIIDGEDSIICVDPYEVKNGEMSIKEIEAREGFVFLGKSESKFWDLYFNTSEIKNGKCYEIKVCDITYNGFCSYIDSENITMVLYSVMGTIGAITYDPTACGKYNDNIKYLKFPSEPAFIHNSITSGCIAKINLNELKEDCVYFKELR